MYTLAAVVVVVAVDANTVVAAPIVCNSDRQHALGGQVFLIKLYLF